MRYETVQADITVIGGGLAGVSAAVSAARLGCKVSLVQNRPVLGGNSSSEIRVWVVGATGHGVNRYARETGIMGEMFIENQYTNPEGNPYYWDYIVKDLVQNEPLIQLFLNTDVHEVEAVEDGGQQRIVSATGWMMGSERKIRFESEMFLDCSGDGLIGFLAGAKYRIGREAKYEFDEPWGLEEPDDIKLGSTLLFYTKDVGFPVKYVPPGFAKDITKTPIPENRIIRSGDSGCFYWWIEWGGHLDTVHDNEQIRDELSSVISGIWDYIKNSGKFQADNLTLEWVGNVPAKREYRRFIGDYVLNQNDIEGQIEFDDSVAFGGWSIDLHDPKGMYGAEGSRHIQPDGIFHIPFRSLYSVNTRNLLFAGRNISATHIAFGSTRVQGTCATLGEAAGTAAALCVQKKVEPRELNASHIQDLQRVLLRRDASMIGVLVSDPDNIALDASVTASSTMSRVAVEQADEKFRLMTDVGLTIPVEPELQEIQFLLDIHEESSEVEVELWDTGRPENYIPINLQAKHRVQVRKGDNQWVTFKLPWRPDCAQNAFVVVKENPHVSIGLAHQALSGVLAYVREKEKNVARGVEGLDHDQPVVQWSMRRVPRQTFCFRVQTEAYSPLKVIDGYLRPYGGPNMWASEAMSSGEEQWIELAWPTVRNIQQVQFIFNDDVNEDLINLHHHKSPHEIIPELVKRYRVEAWVGESWQVLHQENANRRRKNNFAFEVCATNRIRLVVQETNGCERAEVMEFRVFENRVVLD
jgi:hypothetical protein